MIKIALVLKMQISVPNTVFGVIEVETFSGVAVAKVGNVRLKAVPAMLQAENAIQTYALVEQVPILLGNQRQIKDAEMIT